MKLEILKGYKAKIDGVREVRKDELFQYLEEEFDRKNNIHTIEIP